MELFKMISGKGQVVEEATDAGNDDSVDARKEDAVDPKDVKAEVPRDPSPGGGGEEIEQMEDQSVDKSVTTENQEEDVEPNKILEFFGFGKSQKKQDVEEGKNDETSEAEKEDPTSSDGDEKTGQEQEGENDETSEAEKEDPVCSDEKTGQGQENKTADEDKPDMEAGQGEHETEDESKTDDKTTDKNEAEEDTTDEREESEDGKPKPGKIYPGTDTHQALRVISSSGGAAEKRSKPLGAFVADCGPEKNNKLFSYKKAVYERLLRMPHNIVEQDVEEGDVVSPLVDETHTKSARRSELGLVQTETGVYSSISLCKDFGHHHLKCWDSFVNRFCCKCCEKFTRNEPFLEKYGIAVTLYFLFVKFMMGLMVMLTIINIPSMIFYSFGTGLTEAEYEASIAANKLNAMYLTTIGSLGETDYYCKAAKEGEEVTFSCNAEAELITDVIAYYGSPFGQCGCPDAQTYSSTNGCPNDEVDGSCVEGEYCYSGTTEFGDYCCSNSLDDDDVPDFSDLVLAPNATCNTDYLQTFMEENCLGENSCSFRLPEFSSNDDAETVLGGTLSGCGQTLTLKAIVECKATHLTIYDMELKKTDLATLAAYLDAIGMLIFLICMVFLYHRQKSIVDETDKEVCSADDYTVEVYGLPLTDDTVKLEKDLKKHFENLLKNEPEYKFKDECKVADVNLGLSIAKQMTKRIQRGKIARKLDETKNFETLLDKKVKENKATAWTLKDQQKKVEKIQAKFDKKNAELEKLSNNGTGKGKAKKKERVNRAFVTFETEEGYLRCLKTYSTNLPGVPGCCYRNKKWHLNGKKLLRVKPTCKPDDIIWENIEYQIWTRYIRKFISFVLTVAVLLISFGLIYLGKWYKTELSETYDVDCADYVVLTSSGTNYTNVGDYLTPEGTVQNYKWEELGLSSGEPAVLECFCLQVWDESGYNTMRNYAFNYTINGVSGEETYCWEWFFDYLQVSVLTGLSIMVVLLVNFVLKAVARVLVNMEKHYNKSTMVVSLTWKLFLAQFVNIALIGLLINGNLSIFEISYFSVSAGTGSWSIFSGSYSDFTADWYLDVGVVILTTMLINALSPHCAPFAYMTLQSMKICMDRKCCCHRKEITNKKTQTDLEDLYIGPEFCLEERHASILMNIFVTLTYGAGLPALYPICLFSLFMYYWVDKYLFLRFYSLPPQMGSNLADFAANSMPYAILLHTSFAMWMFSNTDIFPEDGSSVGLSAVSTTSSYTASGDLQTRVLNEKNVLLFFLWLIVAIYILVFHMIWPNIKFNLKVFCCCIYQYCKRLEAFEGNDPYFDALPEEHLFKHVNLPILKPDILERYRQQLELRNQSGQKSSKKKRKLEGNPSYNYLCNETYIKKFALDSECIMIYDEENEDAAMHTRNFIQGSRQLPDNNDIEVGHGTEDGSDVEDGYPDQPDEEKVDDQGTDEEMGDDKANSEEKGDVEAIDDGQKGGGKELEEESDDN